MPGWAVSIVICPFTFAWPSGPSEVVPLAAMVVLAALELKSKVPLMSNVPTSRSPVAWTRT